MYSFTNRKKLKDLEELALLKNEVEKVRLQDKLGKQNYRYEAEELQEPLIATIEDTSESLTKTLEETYNNNNKAIENLNEKVLELMTDKGMIARYLASSLVNLFKPENKSQFRLTKDYNSIRTNDFFDKYKYTSHSIYKNVNF